MKEDGVVSAMAEQLVAAMDLAIKSAVSKQLGTDSWKFEDLAGRIDRVSWQGQELETIYLDGRPLLHIFPPKMHTVEGRQVMKQTIQVVSEEVKNSAQTLQDIIDGTTF